MAIAGEIINPGDSIDISYMAAIQEYTIPISGIYQLEVWGASGGSERDVSVGKGGYSSGYKEFEKDTIIYIVTGGAGNATNYYGGYNGGGNGYSDRVYGGDADGSSGGGATHIAMMSGLLSSLSSNRDKILIVAGGGGGGAGEFYNFQSYIYGGSGGGIASESTKTGGYGFGIGESVRDPDGSEDRGVGRGGGGGYIGGKGGSGLRSNSPGWGGTGYIDGVPEFEKKDTKYSPIMNSGIWVGNGKSKITLIELSRIYNLYHNDEPVKMITGKEVSEVTVNGIIVFK